VEGRATLELLLARYVEATSEIVYLLISGIRARIPAALSASGTLSVSKQDAIQDVDVPPILVVCLCTRLRRCVLLSHLSKDYYTSSDVACAFARFTKSISVKAFMHSPRSAPTDCPFRGSGCYLHSS